MKTQLILISLFSLILCNQPFLRKLAEVTEASCKAEGKKFQAAVAAQCKIGNSIIENISKKSDCVKGAWTQGSEYCTASEITTSTECSGTPKFTAGAEKTAATCIVNDVDLTDRLADSKTCEVALYWTVKCTTTSQTTQADCNSADGSWEAAAQQTERRLDDTGTCTIEKTQSEEECTKAGGTASDGKCSGGTFTKEQCKGTPKYTEGEQKGTCAINGKNLSNRETKSKCEEELKWVSGKCNPYTTILTQKECESEPSFTEATDAKCVEEEKSGSSFLKAINFALLAICLLIL